MRTREAWQGSAGPPSWLGGGTAARGWELGIAKAGARDVLGQGWAWSLLGRENFALRRLQGC